MEATQNRPGSAAITGHNTEQQREPGAGGSGGRPEPRPPLSPGSARAPASGRGCCFMGLSVLFPETQPPAQTGCCDSADRNEFLLQRVRPRLWSVMTGPQECLAVVTANARAWAHLSPHSCARTPLRASCATLLGVIMPRMRDEARGPPPTPGLVLRCAPRSPSDCSVPSASTSSARA